MTLKAQPMYGNEAEAPYLTRIEPVVSNCDADEFVYVVSHDLRNCTRALDEVPQWIREDLDTQGVVLGTILAENLDLLERHARRLDRMLADLLVYSRVGRLQQVGEFWLRELIDDVLTENPVPAHVTLRVDEDLPRMCMGYRDAILMIECVLENVAKHGHADGVALSITGSRQDDTVPLTFMDDGPGVAETDLQRIFRPMTTLRRRDEVEGSGLGLTILRKIADHYDGAVWAGPGPDGVGFTLCMVLRDAAIPDLALDEVVPRSH